MAAVAEYQKALQLDTGRMDVWGELVSVLEKLKCMDEAANCLAQMGGIYQSNEMLPEAANCYFRATQYQPKNVENYSNCASVLILLFEHDRALVGLNKAAQLEPSNANILMQRSAVHGHLGDLPAAIADVERVLKLQPDLPFASVHLASLLLQDGNYDQAEQRCQQLLQKNSDDVEAAYTMGKILVIKNCYEEAEAFYRTSISHQPDYAVAQFGLATVLLARGNFKEGWEKFKWRHNLYMSVNVPGHTAGEHGALLDPESLRSADYSASPRWLVVEDAGIGDQLLFLRFAERLMKQGVKLSFLPSSKLIPVLQRHKFCFDIVSSGDADYDRCLKVGDLPLMCADQSVPSSLRLQALDDRKQSLLARLKEAGPPPYTALTWKAGVTGTGNLQKQIDLTLLGEAFKNTEGTLISVQRNPGVDDAERLARAAGRAVHDFSDTNTDLEDALAIMDIVDQYFGVSNTNMHIRAALGKTAGVLVCNPQEWRWGSSGPESVWFPGFRLYRENHLGWDDALLQLKQDL